ncbi:MAG TPA: pyridoxamine 5'-phosphate oxidase family protein [Flavobacteriales bacterium]|nr:pyridoxamine 5'-phosphate oxidase family protein [Flavobacteriales bacterium]
MAKFLPALDDRLMAFINAQRMFFTGSAPREGRVNVSPKGLDCFRVLSSTRVGYLDLTGSGNETAAHLLENGRLTFMFCAFEGPPLILRLYAHGRSVQPHHAEWSELRTYFGPPMPGERQLIIARSKACRPPADMGCRSMRSKRTASSFMHGLSAKALRVSLNTAKRRIASA